MNQKWNIGKILKITCITFSTAFIISLAATLTLYFQVNSTLHSDPSYLLTTNYFQFSGLATLGLLFPFLLSIAFAMAASAKRSLEKGIVKLKVEENSEHPAAQI